MRAIFLKVLEFSVYGTIWLAVVWLIGLFAGKRYRVMWRYLVCVFIAVHMILPFRIPFLSVDLPFGKEDIASVSGQILQGNQDSVSKQGIQEAGKIVKDRNQETGNDEKQLTARESGKEEEVSDTEVVVTSEKSAAKQQKNIISEYEVLTTVMMYVWILGMIFFFGKILLSYLAFCQMGRRWSLPAATIAEERLGQVRLRYGVRRKIDLRRNSKIKTPMLYRVWKPVILLPDLDYTKEEYDYIFQHEIYHYRHKHVLVKYLLTACKGIYWFCPMIYWMCGRTFADMELLCDEFVVRGGNLERKRAYSMVILRHMLDDAVLKRTPFTTGFYGGKDCMKKRISNIMNTDKKGFGFVVILLMLGVVFVVGGVNWNGTAATQQTEKEKEVQKPEEEAVKQRIAVIGLDRTDGHGLADAIMLVTVDSKQKKIVVNQVPRDLAVDFKEVAKENPNIDVPKNVRKQKLSTAYAAYGYGLLTGGLEKLYNVKIDSHIVVDCSIARELIDAAGGVEVALTKKEALYLNSTNFISKKKNRNVKAGSQLLNGDQAIGYARVRKYEAGSPVVDGKKTAFSDTDARSGRCRNVLLGVVKQIEEKKVDWKKLISVLVSGKVDTSLDVDLCSRQVMNIADKIISGGYQVEISQIKYSDYVEKVDEEQGHYLELKKDKSGDSLKKESGTEADYRYSKSATRAGL